MEIISIMIGVLSLIGTVFSIGYQIGKDIRGDNCGESHRKKRDKSQK